MWTQSVYEIMGLTMNIYDWKSAHKLRPSQLILIMDINTRDERKFCFTIEIRTWAQSQSDKDRKRERQREFRVLVCTTWIQKAIFFVFFVRPQKYIADKTQTTKRCECIVLFRLHFGHVNVYSVLLVLVSSMPLLHCLHAN